MDALTRVATFFPTNTLTVYFIMSNVIINNTGYCEEQQSQLMTALLVIFCVANFMLCFTDTYVATTGGKFWVLIMPFYRPLCFSLPTDTDKDRVYEYYYLRLRDYVHALVSTATFILIIIFSNPVCMCLFPSNRKDGTSRFDGSIVRTVPIVVAIIMAMVMMCLGEPRQMLGYQNVQETCPPIERQLGDNPIYNKYPQESSIPEGDEEGDEELQNGPPHKGGYSGSHSNYGRAPSSRDGGGVEGGGGPRGNGSGYRTPPSEYHSRVGRNSHRDQQPGPASPRAGGGAGSRQMENLSDDY